MVLIDFIQSAEETNSVVALLLEVPDIKYFRKII